MAVVLFKWLMTSFITVLHPFYVGVTEIQHNPAEKSMEISVKLFIDDFESALGKSYNTSIDLTHPKDATRTNQQVADYLSENLRLKINGKPVRLEFVGYEREREAAWCYVQVSNVISVKKIEIENTLLYNSFDKQINLMHCTVGGQRKSSKLVHPDHTAEFDF